jgi:hypothetical protein
LITQRHDRRIQAARELLERGDSGPQRRRHPLDPRRVFRNQNGMTCEQWPDFLCMGTDHHHHGPGCRTECGLDCANNQWVTCNGKQLLRLAHPGRSASGENDGAEAEGFCCGKT